MTDKICTNTIFNKSTLWVADAIVKIIDDLFEYLPLTVRQVYYQLVAKLILENDIKEYKKVSRILTKLRENGIVPWSAIHDTTRITTDKRGYSDVFLWLTEKVKVISPEYYGRCYVQNQSVYVEVSLEKTALASIVESELWPFCTRLNIIRGQNSTTHVEKMATRFDNAIMKGQKPILLHYGDLDPSGVAIEKSMTKRFKRVHGIDVDVLRIGLTPEQVEKYKLPQSIEAIKKKKKDPNYKAWIREYGEDQTAVELDALHPVLLKQLLREKLYEVYDMEGMAFEQEKERKDREFVNRVKMDLRFVLYDKYPEVYDKLFE